MSKRAVFYVRQSEDVSEGIDRQIARCTALAEAKGWEVASLPYTDNETSASKVRGPKTAWARMLVDAKRGEFDYVIAVDLDRLLRSITDLSALIEAGARVVTVDGEIDLSTADGEFRATMLAAIARFEVRRKSERQKRANVYRISKGLPVAGGRRRFGFENDHITVNEVEAGWLRTLFLKITEGASLGSLARLLNASNVPCVTKGKWNPARIRKLLVNPAYVGSVIHHGLAHPSETAPVIVKRELYERVQTIMGDPSRRKTQTTVRRALMGGLGECGTCGAPLVSAGTKYRGEMVDTYACSAVKGGQTKGEGHPSIRRAILDTEVRRQVIAAFLMGRESDFAETVGTDLPRIERELADLGVRRSNLLKIVHADVGVDLRDVLKSLSQIARDIEVAAARKDELRAASAHAQMLIERRSGLFTSGRVSFQDAGAIMAELELKFDALDLDAQRALVRDLLEVKVSTGRGLDRVSIFHKVVTSLNDDDDELFDLGPVFEVAP